MKWQLLPFEELYLIPSRNGINRPSRMRGNGYKMINMGELFTYGRIRNPDMELVPLNSREIEEFGVETGDLLFARQSLIASGAGKCSIVVEVPEITVFEGHLIRVRLDQTKADPLFYYYFFSSHEGNGSIQSLVMQVAAAGIRGSELAKLPVPLPPIDIQHRIASILSAYDDLIENNNRRIALLEESMRLLYREWFVRLRFPGHEHVRVIDGLPEGWERTKLREVTSYINRGISPKYEDSDNRWVINQKCVREGKLNTFLARQHITEFGIDKRVKFGDVLVNSTGIGTLGRVAQVYEELENYTVDSHITIVRPNKRVEIDFFGLFLLGLQSYFEQMGAGSTGQTELSRDSIANANFILPTIELQKEFGNYISSQRQMIQNLLTQNKKLSEARDLLLPRLMSGEIDVS